MAKPAKPFVFQLGESEIAQIQEPSGSGERATLYRMIKEQLDDGRGVVALDDAQFGQLVRHMARDGDPFHEAMFRAFSSSVYGLLAIHVADPGGLPS